MYVLIKGVDYERYGQHDEAGSKASIKNVKNAR
jgi:hypothetical protein